jgi:CheY-like chemotaxis protein
LRILVAEDSPVNQLVALHLLAKLGQEADVAGDGLEVLEKLRLRRYDLLFLDSRMPKMDGLETARAVVEAWDRKDRPRMVAMTAAAMEGDREACLAAGMGDYLTKPVRIRELERVLRESAQTRGSEEVLPARAPVSTPAQPAKDDHEPDRADLPLIDEGTYWDMVSRMEEVAAEILELYLAEGPDRVAGLLSGLEAGDAERIIDAAHRLKSSSALVGAARLSALCASIEASLRAGAPAAELASGIHAVADLLVPTMEALRSLSGGTPDEAR